LTTDVDLTTHQGNHTESPSDDPILPEVYTATVACIYNADGRCNKGMLTLGKCKGKGKCKGLLTLGKCKGILTLRRLNILQKIAKFSGLHDNIHPPPIIYIRSNKSCIGACGPHHTQRYSRHASQKVKNSFSRLLSPHIITAVQKWALVT
jgi:hypothetical protein